MYWNKLHGHNHATPSGGADAADAAIFGGTSAAAAAEGGAQAPALTTTIFGGFGAADPPSSDDAAMGGGGFPGLPGGNGVLDVLEAMNPFATRSKVGAEPAAEHSEVVLDYQQLVWSDEGRQLPPGVNAAKLEAHLSEGQFQQVLGMGRAEFYAMSKVEQMRCKQEVGLF